MREFELVRQYDNDDDDGHDDLRLHEEGYDNHWSNEFSSAEFHNDGAVFRTNQSHQRKRWGIVATILVVTMVVALALNTSERGNNNNNSNNNGNDSDSRGQDNDNGLGFPAWKLEITMQGWDPKDSVGDSLAVSSDGTSIVLGSTQTSFGDRLPDDRGSVAHYTLRRGAWMRRSNHLLGAKGHDGFGAAVALTERLSKTQVLAVGAPQRMEFQQPNSTGYVQTYDYDETKEQWSPLGSRINGTDYNHGGNDGCFGGSVALSWPVLAVGDVCDDGSNNTDKDANLGSVHVYVWHYSDWKLEQTLMGQDRGDQFGKPVILNDDGDVMVVTSLMNDPENDFSNVGRVQAYVRLFENDDGHPNDNGREWKPMGQALEGTAKDDWFGFALSVTTIKSKIPKTFLAVSCVYDDGSDNHSDFVRVYEFVNHRWQPLGQDLRSSSYLDRFGLSLSLVAHPTHKDSLLLAVGSHSSTERQGWVDVYRYNLTDAEDPQWERFTERLAGPSDGDFFGFPVVLSSAPASGSEPDGKLSLVVRNSRAHRATNTSKATVGSVHMYTLAN